MPPPRTPSLWRTSSMFHHRPVNANKTLTYDILELYQRPHSWLSEFGEILTLFNDFSFSISIFESIPELYKHKRLGQRGCSRFCSKGAVSRCNMTEWDTVTILIWQFWTLLPFSIESLRRSGTRRTRQVLTCSWTSIPIYGLFSAVVSRPENIVRVLSRQ